MQVSNQSLSEPPIFILVIQNYHNPESLCGVARLLSIFLLVLSCISHRLHPPMHDIHHLRNPKAMFAGSSTSTRVNLPSKPFRKLSSTTERSSLCKKGCLLQICPFRNGKCAILQSRSSFQMAPKCCICACRTKDEFLRYLDLSQVFKTPARLFLRISDNYTTFWWPGHNYNSAAYALATGRTNVRLHGLLCSKSVNPVCNEKFWPGNREQPPAWRW